MYVYRCCTAEGERPEASMDGQGSGQAVLPGRPTELLHSHGRGCAVHEQSCHGSLRGCPRAAMASSRAANGVSEQPGGGGAARVCRGRPRAVVERPSVRTERPWGCSVFATENRGRERTEKEREYQREKEGKGKKMVTCCRSW